MVSIVVCDIFSNFKACFGGKKRHSDAYCFFTDENEISNVSDILSNNEEISIISSLYGRLLTERQYDIAFHIHAPPSHWLALE